MGSVSIPAGARELLAVVGVGVAGLVLAGLAAFGPWYPPGAPDPAVIELHGPVAPVAPAAQR